MMPPPPPSWVILGAIPRVSTDDLSLHLAAPPRVSLLTIPKRVFPADEDHVTNPPKILAADPSGLLLLHADQGRATGPTVIDRPNHHSFCWRQFVAGYFVLNADADADAIPLPEPELIMNAANLGIIASASAYMVAELQPFVGDDHATLLCFSSDVGEWVDKTVSYPLPARPFSCHAVLSLHGRLWWADLSWCILACDPFADNPHLAVLPLPPPAQPLSYGQAAAVLDRYRALGVSDGKLRFVDMYRNRDPTGALQVTVWTLPDPDSNQWALEHQASFHHIWDQPTYKAAGLPTKIPVLALIHPDNPAVVYFFLDNHLFGVDLRDCTVVSCDLYHLVNPPTDLVSTSFVHAWKPPKALHSPSSPGFAKEDTDSGSNGVDATASAHI